MWICAWRIIWTHRTALILTAMWIPKGTVEIRKLNRRKMRRRKMRRRRRWWMRMRRRKRMRIMAKNLARLAKERW
jgi:hypothetical protein